MGVVIVVVLFIFFFILFFEKKKECEVRWVGRKMDMVVGEGRRIVEFRRSRVQETKKQSMRKAGRNRSRDERNLKTPGSK